MESVEISDTKLYSTQSYQSNQILQGIILLIIVTSTICKSMCFNQQVY